MAKPVPMIIGQKGVTYGLQKPAAKPLAKSNLFSADDAQLSVPEMIKKEQTSNKKQKKAQEEIAKALAMDPTVFSYDEIYDDMKKSQQQADPEDKRKKREPKYIKQLLEQAIEREKDDNIIFQKKLQRELEEEKELYGAESEKFVTTSYLRQIELNKIHEEEQKKKEAMEKAHTAEKAGMSAFYLNMLDKKNVAMGGTKEELKELANRVGQKRTREQELLDEEKEDAEERDRDRKRRLRERAERDNEQAEQLRKQREEEKIRQVKELQQQYVQHTVNNDEKEQAKQRALQRMQARKEAKAQEMLPKEQKS